MNIKKMLKLIFFIIVPLLLLSAGLAIACVVSSGRSGTAAAEHAPNQTVTGGLGQTIRLKVNCELPWAQKLTQITFTPGEGMVQAGNIKTAVTKYSLQGRKLQLEIPISAYRTGKLSPGNLQLTVARPWFKNGPEQINLPVSFDLINITAATVNDRNQLPLADELHLPVKSARQYYYWLIGGILATVIILLWAIVFLRKKQTQILLQPPWVIAAEQLHQLRQTATDGSQPLTWCVAKLTDVVRSYLSKQFHLPVQQQTTEEFFADMQHKNSPLTSRQITYLRDFMRSADLIKYANIKPDAQAFYQAVDHAEELVQETGSPEPEKESATSTENQL